MSGSSVLVHRSPARDSALTYPESAEEEVVFHVGKGAAGSSIVKNRAQAVRDCKAGDPLAKGRQPQPNPCSSIRAATCSQKGWRLPRCAWPAQ